MLPNVPCIDTEVVKTMDSPSLLKMLFSLKTKKVISQLSTYAYFVLVRPMPIKICKMASTINLIHV